MIFSKVSEKKYSASACGLIRYILGQKINEDLRLGDKVLGAWSNNCVSGDDFELAGLEIKATQALNTRAKSDKTYHLIVSLGKGESLDVAAFKDIADRMCEALGLGEHQRVCAIHGDTGNLHMHMAVNKIHPETHRYVDPFQDYKKRDVVCREMEKKYGLSVGVSGGAKEKDPNEVKRYFETFTKWLKTYVAEGLHEVLATHGVNWEKVQDYLAKFGTELRPHGAGFVFSQKGKKVFTKASSVDRKFSKYFLNLKLGEHTQYTSPVTPTTVYKGYPNGMEAKDFKAWDEYQKEKKEHYLKSQLAIIERDKKLDALKTWAEQQEKNTKDSHKYEPIAKMRLVTQLWVDRDFKSRKLKEAAQSKPFLSFDAWKINRVLDVSMKDSPELSLTETAQGVHKNFEAKRKHIKHSLILSDSNKANILKKLEKQEKKVLDDLKFGLTKKVGQHATELAKIRDWAEKKEKELSDDVLFSPPQKMKILAQIQFEREYRTRAILEAKYASNTGKNQEKEVQAKAQDIHNRYERKRKVINEAILFSDKKKLELVRKTIKDEREALNKIGFGRYRKKEPTTEL